MRNFMRVLFFLSDISPRCRRTVADMGLNYCAPASRTFPLPGEYLSSRDYFPLLQTFAGSSALWEISAFSENLKISTFSDIFQENIRYDEIPQGILDISVKSMETFGNGKFDFFFRNKMMSRR